MEGRRGGTLNERIRDSSGQTCMDIIPEFTSLYEFEISRGLEIKRGANWYSQAGQRLVLEWGRLTGIFERQGLILESDH